MSETIITVSKLSKSYLVGHEIVRERYASLRDSAARVAKTFARKTIDMARGRQIVQGDEVEEFWALKNVSFEVKRGEVVGIIGRNGAGKSTLLKVLSRITEPTEGRVVLGGRVASLLEVGTGFHPELTGRENVFLNGTILGMTRREIRSKFDEIAAFAGVEKFLDTPVKRYSSGMYVRLAFAVAAHLEPEILLIDEVLSVGDLEFQKKCIGKMNEVSKSGRTILFVSHNMAAVEAICERSMLLDQGILAYYGITQKVVARYRGTVVKHVYDVDLTQHPSRVIKKSPTFTRFRILDDDSRVLPFLTPGKSAIFEFMLSCSETLINPVVGMHFYNMFDQRVATFHSRYQSELHWVAKGTTLLSCRCPIIQLAPGSYRIVIGLAVLGEQMDRIDPVASIEVVSSDFYLTGRTPPQRDGLFWPLAEWSVEENAETMNKT